MARASCPCVARPSRPCYIIVQGQDALATVQGRDALATMADSPQDGTRQTAWRTFMLSEIEPRRLRASGKRNVFLILKTLQENNGTNGTETVLIRVKLVPQVSVSGKKD